jgi:hypothetical protein
LSSSSARIDWTGLTQAGVTYNVYRSTANYFSISGLNPIAPSQPGTTFPDSSGLLPHTTYYYSITAVSAQGVESAQSASYPNVLMPPAKPTNLEAFVAANNQVHLYWNTINDNDVGYRVYRSLDAASKGTCVSGIWDLGHTASEFCDTTVPTTGTYYYHVVAVIAGAPGLESDPSNVVSADTSQVYEPANVTFDETMLVDAASTVDISDVSGAYEIPFYNEHGAIVSASISTPEDDADPFTISDDYTFSLDSVTGNIALTDLRGAAAYRIETVRSYGTRTYSEVIQVLDGIASASGPSSAPTTFPTTNPIPWIVAVDLPAADVYVISTAQAPYDNGFLVNAWNCLGGANLRPSTHDEQRSLNDPRSGGLVS